MDSRRLACLVSLIYISDNSLKSCGSAVGERLFLNLPITYIIILITKINYIKKLHTVRLDSNQGLYQTGERSCELSDSPSHQTLRNDCMCLFDWSYCLFLLLISPHKKILKPWCNETARCCLTILLRTFFAL